jgi:membrane-associated protease RseP (regulator of RpoE activity)
MKALLIGLLAFLSAGGASIAAPAYPVQIKDDKFSAAATFIGPSKAVSPLLGTSRSWFVRSSLNKSDHTVAHQLYVETSYLGHWRFWETAADDHATSLPVEAIDRNVDDCSGICSYSETVAVELDDAFLRANATSGFEIKLSAKSGDDLVISVAPAQIEPVLAAIAAYSVASPVATATAPGPAAPAAPSAGKGALGVAISDMPGALAAAIGRPDLKGAFIAVVAPGSVAERAGLKAGDCVTTYGGHPITGRFDLVAAVRATAPGSAVPVSVVRGKDAVALTLTF